MSINEHNAAYRRGVILGLTMAEIMLLVIFLLLLTFMAIIKNEREKYEHKLALVTKNPYVDRISSILDKQNPDIMEELVRANEKLPEIIAMIKKEDVKSNNNESVSDVIARGIEKLKFEKQLSKQTGSISAEQQLQQALTSQETLKTEVENLKGQNKSLIKQIESQSHGNGAVLPPCWPDENGKPEYIYDVFLYNNGIAIKDNKIPHRAVEQSKLPISTIVYNSIISSDLFESQTASLLEWSQQHDCRFYVRVYDETSSDQKRIYKDNLRAVEGTFYKYLM